MGRICFYKCKVLLLVMDRLVLKLFNLKFKSVVEENKILLVLE